MRQNRQSLELDELGALTLGQPIPVFASLERWLSDAAADEAARERSQERSLRDAAEQSATFVGVLVDMAERGERVVLRTTTGRMLQGAIRAVGRDFVVIAGDASAAFVSLSGVAAVRLHPGRRSEDTSGDRAAPVDASFAALLAGVAGDRPRVQVGVTGEPHPVTGELRAVGLDVMTIALDGSTTAYVPMTNLVELIVLG